MRRFLRKLRNAFDSAKAEQELDRELKAHLALIEDEYRRQGMDARESRTAARRALGGIEQTKELHREARSFPFLDQTRQDVTYALRTLRKSPGFAGTALLTLALGIGAATTVFSELNAVFFRKLPVNRPEELRSIVWTSPNRGFLNTPAVAGPQVAAGASFASFPYPMYREIRDASASIFSEVACWMDPGEVLPVVMGEFGFGSVQFVSGNYFQTLGINASLGRTLRSEDDVEKSPAALAVLSHRFWQRAFGGDPAVLSRTINLNGNQFEIVGVLPGEFFGIDPSISPDLMVPIAMLHIASAGGVGVLGANGNWSICRIVARMRPNASEEQGRVLAETAVHQQFGQSTQFGQWPPRGRQYEIPKLWIVRAERGIDSLHPTREPVLVLMTVVGVILLIACANIAGLLLARATSRRQEISIRLAIGAPRSRLIRQLLTESLLLSAAGGVAGFAIAWTLSRFAPSLVSRLMPVINGADRNIGVAVMPDGRVFAFSAALILIAGIVFGLVPALRATKINPSTMSRLSSGKAMVAIQAALSVLLLIGAGLFLRTVVNLRSIDLGFQPEGLLYVRVEPRVGGLQRDTSSPEAVRQSTFRRAAFFENVVKHLEKTPGVASATAAIDPPLTAFEGAGNVGTGVSNACTTYFDRQDPGEARIRSEAVGPRYFETMRQPLLIGRDFQWVDRVPASRQRIGIVNESFVKKFFAPGTNPIGETLGYGIGCERRNLSELTVVGVVSDSQVLPREKPMPTLYQPYATPVRPLTVILRTDGDPLMVLPAVRRAMAEFSAEVPLFGEVTPAYLRNQHIRQERLLGALLGVFGLFALILCCLGIYGLLAYTVSRRVSEIGVRMALGAGARDVIRMIVQESLAPVAIGLAAGIAAALALSQLVESMLYGVSAHDPLSIAGAVILFIIIAAIAAALPAFRATRIDPLRALRYE